MNSLETSRNYQDTQESNFNLIDVNKRDWQDSLEINDKEFQKIKQFIESNKNIDKDRVDEYESMFDNLRNKINSLNQELDDLMDVSLFDWGEVDLEDGQDTIYLKEIAKDVNKAINEFLEEIQDTQETLDSDIESLSSRIDDASAEYLSVSRLKSFVSDLENLQKEYWKADGDLKSNGGGTKELADGFLRLTVVIEEDGSVTLRFDYNTEIITQKLFSGK